MAVQVMKQRFWNTQYRALLGYCAVLAALCVLQLMIASWVSMSLVLSLAAFHTGTQLLHHIITICCYHRDTPLQRFSSSSSSMMDLEAKSSSTAKKIDTDTEFNVYSYGVWGRLEVILRFSNAIFVAFFCFAMVTEAMQGIIDPHEINIRFVWFLGVLGLFVNLAGVYFFSTDASANPTAAIMSSGVADMSGSSFNRSLFHGQVPLHAPIDGYGGSGGIAAQYSSMTKARKQSVIFNDLVMTTNTNVAVLISTFLIEVTGYESLDTIIAILASGWLFYLYVPSITTAGKILLQTSSESSKSTVSKLLRETSAIDGVLECRALNLWTTSYRKTSLVGTIKLLVANHADEQSILQQVKQVFQPVIGDLTVQIVKSNWNLRH